MDKTLAIKWHLEGILLSRIEKAIQSLSYTPKSPKGDFKKNSCQ